MAFPPPASPAFEVAAHSGGEAKRSYVRSMFTAIAPRYDFLNHLLSLNVDRRWRRAAVARLGWEARPDGVYLDLCAGTLDLAATLARAGGFRGSVIGADFVVPMLARGRGKAERARPVGADALTLPFADAHSEGDHGAVEPREPGRGARRGDRKSTRLNSSHLGISYAVFCLKKTKGENQTE